MEGDPHSSYLFILIFPISIYFLIFDGHLSEQLIKHPPQIFLLLPQLLIRSSLLVNDQQLARLYESTQYVIVKLQIK